MSAFPFDLYFVVSITVEHNHQEQKLTAIRHLLTVENGFREAKGIGGGSTDMDAYFVRMDALEGQMKMPPACELGELG